MYNSQAKKHKFKFHGNDVTYDEDIQRVQSVQFCLPSPYEIKRRSVVHVKSDIHYESNTYIPKRDGLFDPRMGTLVPKKYCMTDGLSNNICPGYTGHIELPFPVITFIKFVIEKLKMICYKCGEILLDRTLLKNGTIENILKISKGTKRQAEVLRLISTQSLKTCSACDTLQPIKYDYNELHIHAIFEEKCIAQTKKLISILPPKKRGRKRKQIMPDENHTVEMDTEVNDDFVDENMVSGKTSNNVDELMVNGSKEVGESINVMTNEVTDMTKNIVRTTKELTSSYIQKLFLNLSNEVIYLIGSHPFLCHPAWMIIDVLSVCSMYVRPSLSDGVTHNEDDITHKLNDIITDSNHLFKEINAFKEKMSEIDLNQSLDIKERELRTNELYSNYKEIFRKLENTVTYDILTMMDDKTPQLSNSVQKSGRQIKGVSSRISRKEGRIRKNLMGKRSNFTARTVIVGDPYLRIDQLGMPIYICSYMNYPETVTYTNYYRLQSYVLNGPYNYPGAKQILSKSDDCLYNLKYSDLTYRANQLRIGDIVIRHLIEGDPVLLNRQPTLHRMSIMTHRIVPMKGKVFRLPIDVCTPYNADFDGDEMNIHVPQCEESKNEMIQLASVSYHFISPGLSRPVITSVQDTMVGIYRLSMEPNNFLFSHEIMNALTTNCNEQLRIYSMKTFLKNRLRLELDDENNIYDGRKIISNIIDPNYSLRTSDILIENGKFISGKITKSIQKKESTGLLHSYLQDLDKLSARDFIDNIRYLATFYILRYGFSIGISDMVIPQYVVNNNKELLNEFLSKLNQDAKRLHNRQKITPDEMETKMNAQKIIDILGKNTLDSIKNFRNRLSDAVTSGSKGSTLNISQIIACVGQQNIDGKRITKGFTDRTLCHFQRFNILPEANGFVKSSFLQGLNPIEFFNHAQSGREGLIDTALKTSLSGYVQRKLMKVLEDVSIHYDHTVRDSNERIVQLFYGNQDLNTCKTETVELPFDFEYIKDNKISLLEYLLEQCMNSTEQFSNGWYIRIQLMAQFIKNSIQQRKPDFLSNKVLFPFHIQRIITSTIINNRNVQQKNIISIDDLLDLVDDTFEYFSGIPIDIYIQENNKYDYQDQKFNVREYNNLLWKCFGNCETLFVLLYSYLSPKRIQISKDQLIIAITKMKEIFLKSKIQPGDMVGVLAAQSIGEPSTQLTLNTFHNSGIGSMTKVTRGVPRLDELLRLSEEPKTCVSKIALKDSTNILDAFNAANQLEHVTLLGLTKDITLLYSDSSGHVLILRILKRSLLEKNLSDRDVYLSLTFLFECNMNIHYNNISDSSEYLNFHISLTNCHHPDGKMILASLEKSVLSKIYLRGIPNIRNVTVRKNKFNTFQNDYLIETNNYQVISEGTNLKHLLIHPLVDSKYTTTNNIWEIITNLGSEAGRTVFIEELSDIISDGSYVNPAHIEILADMMFKYGNPISANRHGSNRGEMGPLTKSTFEESDRHLKKAAIYGEYEEINSVSNNIMFGQVTPCGTGTVYIYFDEKYCSEIMKEINKNQDHRTHFLQQLNKEIMERPINNLNDISVNSSNENNQNYSTIKEKFESDLKNKTENNEDNDNDIEYSHLFSFSD